jgi:RNA polymerase sigma-70 factor, ECF subfamily
VPDLDRKRELFDSMRDGKCLPELCAVYHSLNLLSKYSVRVQVKSAKVVTQKNGGELSKSADVEFWRDTYIHELRPRRGAQAASPGVGRAVPEGELAGRACAIFHGAKSGWKGSVPPSEVVRNIERGQFPVSLLLSESCQGTPITAGENCPSIALLLRANLSEVLKRTGGTPYGLREDSVLEDNDVPNFEQAVLPHIDAAYNLARWLMRNEQDAQDVAQEAYLRAFRFFPGFRGGDARAWLMKIVRNTCYTWLHANRPLQDAKEFDENLFLTDSCPLNPEVVLQNDNSWCEKRWRSSHRIIERYSFFASSRGCPTKRSQISRATPAGTVMSSLSRARGRFRQAG